MIVKANSSDGELLTKIALISKAYWGYSKHDVESWRSDLTVTSRMILESDVYKFILDDKVIGFYILNSPVKDTVELEMLFVLPEFIGKRIGKQLLMHAFENARKSGCRSMTLLADPNAVPFYTSQDFYQINKKESSIPNRFLPVLQKDLV